MAYALFPKCPKCNQCLTVLTETEAGEFDGMHLQWAYLHCQHHLGDEVFVAQKNAQGAFKCIEEYNGRLTKVEIIHYFGAYGGGRKGCPINEQDELIYLARCRPEGLAFEIEASSVPDRKMLTAVLKQLNGNVRIEVIGKQKP